jgi:invasion protein IalB
MLYRRISITFVLDARSFFLMLGLAVLFFCSSSFAFEERVDAEYGKWKLHCGKSTPTADEHCVLAQVVSSEESESTNIGVIIVKRTELTHPILQVIAPIDVVLSNGVNLRIDQNKPLHLNFTRCAAPRCRAELVLDEIILTQLNSGEIADIVIYKSRYAGLRHLVRLDGFKKAYNQLR